MKGRLKRNVAENLNLANQYSGGGSSIIFAIPETQSIVAQSAEGNFLICKVDKYTAMHLGELIGARKYTISFRRVKASVGKEYSLLVRFPEIFTSTNSALLYGPYSGTPIDKELVIDMILEHRLTVGDRLCHTNV